MTEVDEVVAVLERGGVVVLPTDTVYGLAAPPRNVGSLALMRHSTPSTRPIPAMRPAPTGNWLP